MTGYPVKIVDVDHSTGRFLVIHDNIQTLLAKYGTLRRPRVIVAVGPAKTGKSLLLNAIAHSTTGAGGGATILSAAGGFSVDGSQNKGTRGIWMSVRQNSEGAIILLDAECLYANDSSPLFDAKMLAVAMALGSQLLYVVRHYPDAHLFDQLAAIAPQARKMLRYSADESAVASVLPKLHIVVPCFTLALTESTGAWLTRMMAPPADAMAPNFGSRALLCASFPDATLSVLSRPCASDEDARRLPSVPFADIAPDFLRHLGQLSADLAARAPIKRVLDVELSCVSAFLSYLDIVIDAVNTDTITLKSALANVMDVANRRALCAAKTAFASHMASVELPLTEGELHVELQLAARASRQAFVAEAIIDSEDVADAALQTFQFDLESLVEGAEVDNEEATVALVLPLFQAARSRIMTFADERDCGAHSWVVAFREKHGDTVEVFLRDCGARGAASVVAEYATLLNHDVATALARIQAFQTAVDAETAAANTAELEADAARNAVAAAAVREAASMASLVACEAEFVTSLETFAARSRADVQRQGGEHERVIAAMYQAQERRTNDATNVFARVVAGALERDERFVADTLRRGAQLANYFDHHQAIAALDMNTQVRNCGAALQAATQVHRTGLIARAAEAEGRAMVEVANINRPDPIREALLGVAAGLMHTVGHGLLDACMRPRQAVDESLCSVVSRASVGDECHDDEDRGRRESDDAPVHQVGNRDAVSFATAFARARSELGPGKTFTWRGKSYTTDLAAPRARRQPDPRGAETPAIPSASGGGGGRGHGEPTTSKLLPHGTSVAITSEILEQEPSTGVMLLKEVTGYADAERAVKLYQDGDYLGAAISGGLSVAAVVPVAKGVTLCAKGLRIGASAAGRFFSGAATSVRGYFAGRRAAAGAAAAASASTNKAARLTVVDGVANEMHSARYTANTLHEQIAKNSLPTLGAEGFEVMVKGSGIRDLPRLQRQYGAGDWEKVKYVLKSHPGPTANPVTRAEIHAYMDRGRQLVVEPKFKNVKLPD